MCLSEENHYSDNIIEIHVRVCLSDEHNYSDNIEIHVRGCVYQMNIIILIPLLRLVIVDLTPLNELALW